MKTRLILYATGGLLLGAVPARAGSRGAGSGAGAIAIPADTVDGGGGKSTVGSGATAVAVTASIGGIGGTVTAAAVTNQQGYIPQILPIPIPLAAALDTTSLTWTTGGTLPWFGQVTTTHDGMDAARSGLITHEQESWMETTVTGPGALSFWWKVSSEESWDYLRFRLNGAEVSGLDDISGEVDWVQKSVPVPAGSHTLRWTYSKDTLDEGPTTADAAWVDQVVFGSVAGYALWASTNIPAGRDATFDGDWNGDGIRNGVAYVFGNTRVTPSGKGRIAAPTSIPADVNVYLDRNTTLTGSPGWTAVASWVNGASPTFASGVSIVSGEVRDAFTGPRAYYRYRVVKR